MKLKDYQYKPSHTDDDVSAAKKWLKENKRTSGITAFAGFDKGIAVTIKNNQPCHGQICNVDFRKASVIATAVCWKDRNNYNSHYSSPQYAFGKGERKDFLPFMELIIELGGPFLLERDLDFCLDYGLVISAEAPQPIVMMLCILSRHFFECKLSAFLNYNKLVDLGMPPRVAYNATMNTFMSQGAYMVTTWETQPARCSQGSHRAFPAMTLKNLKKFCDDDFDLPVTNSFRAGPTTQNVYKMFNDGRNNYDPNYTKGKPFWEELILSRKDVQATLREFRAPGSPDLYRPPNPFTRASNAIPILPHQCTPKELYDCVLPYICKTGIEGIFNGRQDHDELAGLEAVGDLIAA